MGGFFQKVKQWWDVADRNQKVLTVGGAAFLVLLLAGIFYFASKPKMQLLFGGLSASEQGSVVTELEKQGIPTDFNEQGSVMVPSNMVAEARMKLAQANKLPTTTGFGDADLAKIGIMNTPEVEKERLKNILEQKLDQSIESIDGIENANVNIVLGDSSPFIQDQRKASASVTLNTRADANITKSQSRTIALLVKNSVPGLSLSDISVVDNNMNLLFDGHDDASANGAISDRLATEESEEKRREQQLQSMLDQVYGPNSTIVKINLDMNFDDSAFTETKNTPSSKLPTTNITESMSGGSLTPGGAAGTASNSNGQIGAPAAGGAGSSSSGYTLTQTQNDYFKDTKVTNVKQASGDLKSMAIDVIANSSVVKDQANVQNIVNGYLGSLANTTGFTSQVTMVKFSDTAAKLQEKAASAASSQQRIQQIISILPIAALIFIGFVVLKQFSKFSKGGGIPTLAAVSGGSMDLGGGGAAGFSEYPEGIDSSLAIGPGGTPMNGTAHRRPKNPNMPEEDDDDDPIRVKSIGTKVNVPLEQLKKMGDKKPEAVAMLVKGWIAE